MIIDPGRAARRRSITAICWAKSGLRPLPILRTSTTSSERWKAFSTASTTASGILPFDRACRVEDIADHELAGRDAEPGAGCRFWHRRTGFHDAGQYGHGPVGASGDRRRGEAGQGAQLVIGREPIGPAGRKIALLPGEVADGFTTVEETARSHRLQLVLDVRVRDDDVARVVERKILEQIVERDVSVHARRSGSRDPGVGSRRTPAPGTARSSQSRGRSDFGNTQRR